MTGTPLPLNLVPLNLVPPLGYPLIWYPTAPRFYEALHISFLYFSGFGEGCILLSQSVRFAVREMQYAPRNLGKGRR